MELTAPWEPLDLQVVLVLGASQALQEKEDHPDHQVLLVAMDLLETPEREVLPEYRVIRVALGFQVKQVTSAPRECLVSQDKRVTRDHLVASGRVDYLDQLDHKETEAAVVKQGHLDLQANLDLQDQRDKSDHLVLLGLQVL